MDLSTTYMGMKLANPLVVSAGPMSMDLDSLRKMEDSGAAAVVLASLFEEQIQHEAMELDFYLQHGADRWAEATTYFPHQQDYKLGPEEYLDHVSAAKGAVAIPVIASLNGLSTGGWISYARKIEQAGADAIELNVYFIPTDPRLASHRVEEAYLAVLQAVKSAVSIPVAMKLSPFFSATASMAARLASAGVDALVLFNRFYQPDIDIDNLEVRPSLTLSSSLEMRLPLRWVAILHGKIRASLAGSGGIHTAQDVAKMILVGADVTMMCSALLKHGISHLATMRAGLVEIMAAKEYESVQQMKGILSLRNCPEPAAFERANYLKTLHSFGWTATRE